MPNRLTQVVVATNTPTSRSSATCSRRPSTGRISGRPARLTLQGGVRYDHLLTNYPDSVRRRPGLRLRRTGDPLSRRGRPRASSGTTSPPRMGAAYDLFGNGKTAVKFNLGKYMEAFSATNTDLDLNPLIRTTISTTRDVDRHEQGFRGELRSRRTPSKNGECAAMDNKNLGKEVFTRSYDPDFVDRLGRPSLQLGPRAFGPAGSPPARVGERRLLPQLVGQLVRRGQPVDRAGGLHAVQHHRAGRCAAAGRRRPDDQRAVQPRSGARSGWSTSSRRSRATSRSRPRTGRAWTSTSSRGCATG